MPMFYNFFFFLIHVRNPLSVYSFMQLLVREEYHLPVDVVCIVDYLLFSTRLLLYIFCCVYFELRWLYSINTLYTTSVTLTLTLTLGVDSRLSAHIYMVPPSTVHPYAHMQAKEFPTEELSAGVRNFRSSSSCFIKLKHLAVHSVHFRSFE